MSSQHHQKSCDELAHIAISTAVESSHSMTQGNSRQTETILAAQVRSSESTTTLQLEGDMNPPEALSSRKANHKAEHSANLSSQTKVLQTETDSGHYQQSLDGILDMIESAVYPHCIAASSPTGSIGSQCNALLTLENFRTSEDSQMKGISRSGEELMIGGVADKEHIDAYKNQSKAGLNGQKDAMTSVEQSGATSSTGGHHDDVTKAASTHVVDNNDPFPAPSNRSNATVKDQLHPQSSAAGSFHIGSVKASDLEGPSHREAIAASSFVNKISIVKSTDFSASKPRQDQTSEKIHEPELTHGKVTLGEHSSTSHVSAAPSSSGENSVEPMPPMLSETISLSNARPAEFTAAAKSASMGCETKEEPVKGSVSSSPAIGDEQNDPSVELSVSWPPVTSEVEAETGVISELTVSEAIGNSQMEEVPLSSPKPTKESQEQQDQGRADPSATATPDDAEVETSVPDLSAKGKPTSPFASAKRQQEQLASGIPRETQESQANNNARGRAQGHPPQVSTLDTLHLAGLAHVASQAEVHRASQTCTQSLLELSTDRAGRSLKRTSTLATTEEQKRRKIRIPGLENTSLGRFPSSEPLKGHVRETSKPKTRRTFSMPVPENSVFYDVADVVSSPSSPASKVDQHIVPAHDWQSFPSEGARPSRIISLAQTDLSRESARRQALLNSATKNGENEGTGKVRSAGGDNVEGSPIAESAVDRQRCSQLSAPYPERETHSPVTTPPDSGNPAEKMRYAGAHHSSLEDPPALELDDVPGKGNPGRLLVPFTRFRRPQPLYSSLTVNHKSKDTRLSSHSDSTLFIDNAPRRTAVHENMLPGSPHLRMDEDRKRKPSPRDRELRAVKKLKQPFKSPMLVRDMAPTCPRPGSAEPLEDNFAQQDLTATQCSIAQPSDQSVCISSGTGSNLGPQSLYAKRIVTERLASSFSSPFSSPLKTTEAAPGPNDGTYHKLSTLDRDRQEQVKGDAHLQLSSTMTDIAALEKQKHILKQAIKIRRTPKEEERLRGLVTQWRNAGRDVTEMLFQVIARPEPSMNEEAVYSALPDMENSSSETVDPDRQLQIMKREKIAEDWNYGTMLRALQVDPHLLGWDEEAEDWRD